MAKKKRARRSKAVDLGGVSIEQLQAELERREAEAEELEAERAELVDRIDEIDAHLAEIDALAAGAGTSQGGRSKKKRRTSGRKKTTKRGARRRPKNDMNLVDALAHTLKGKTMSVTEVAEAVQKNGYKTTSPNFRTIVNQTLIKHKGTFSKQGRGLYTAK
ncbi:MAG: hypothetical protein AAFX79_10625 [Planctomycetota bacterium]